ncbi:MAG: hypothetical protein K2X47_20290, partial [Bdellovibrionales bacterium]|nr:hypothetical protein [Bdellovibrionales bacterium]
MHELMKWVLFFVSIGLPYLLGCSKAEERAAVPASAGTTIEFSGIGQLGIFDPSVAKDPSSSRVWMAFSSVDPSAQWPANTRAISSHLAYSDNGGTSWTYDRVISSFTDVTIGLAAPNNAGTWDHEVSQLVYDENAPTNEKWKIFWHHYLQINGTRTFEHGWIAYKAASTPALLQSATEHKLFAGTIYDTSNNSTGGATQSPVSGAPEVNFTGLHANLGSCGNLTEPGALSTSSGLYLVLHCQVLTGTPDNLIVLLKYTQGTNTWSYVGTLLRNADATALGFDRGFSAPSMVTLSGVDYLLVTPARLSPFDGYYDGCHLFPFSGIATGALTGSTGARTPTLYLQT